VLKHYFVLPEKRDLPSGGNRYNSFLIRALKNKGVLLSTGDPDQALQALKKDLPMWI